jgi:ketosteroid isomerase-like protein
VLSETALRSIGNIDREQIERRIRRFYEYWAQGDVERMIEYLAPDVSFPSNGFWTGIKPPVAGREQAAGTIRKYANMLENIVSVLHEFVIDGDRAVVHRTAVGRRRDTGRRYQCDFIDFFRFRDGLIVEFSEYADAAWIEIES